jgi:hypothetical protein
LSDNLDLGSPDALLLFGLYKSAQKLQRAYAELFHVNQLKRTRVGHGLKAGVSRIDMLDVCVDARELG